MAPISVRRSAINQAQAYLKLKPVYLDTETTGLEGADQVVDICILDHNGKVLIDSLVKPKGKIPSAATCIHGITNELVKDAPTWPELWPEIEAALTDRWTAVYNAEFDVRLMKQTQRKYRSPWTLADYRFFCVMRLYARFYGQWNPYHGDYRWQKLEAAGKQCKIALPNAHRAKVDALLAREVLRHMAERKR